MSGITRVFDIATEKIIYINEIENYSGGEVLCTRCARKLEYIPVEKYYLHSSKNYECDNDDDLEHNKIFKVAASKLVNIIKRDKRLDIFRVCLGVAYLGTCKALLIDQMILETDDTIKVDDQNDNYDRFIRIRNKDGKTKYFIELDEDSYANKDCDYIFPIEEILNEDTNRFRCQKDFYCEKCLKDKTLCTGTGECIYDKKLSCNKKCKAKTCYQCKKEGPAYIIDNHCHKDDPVIITSDDLPATNSSFDPASISSCTVS